MSASALVEMKAIAIPFHVKRDALDEDSRTFEGLAATWDLDLGGDVIHRGAFKRTLEEWQKAGSVIPLLDLLTAANATAVAEGRARDLQVEMVTREERVKEAFLLDLQGKVLAPSSRVISFATYDACPPSSPAARRSSGSRRPTSTTAAPALTKQRAMPRPRPLPPPVISTLSPSSENAPSHRHRAWNGSSLNRVAGCFAGRLRRCFGVAGVSINQSSISFSSLKENPHPGSLLGRAKPSVTRIG